MKTCSNCASPATGTTCKMFFPGGCKTRKGKCQCGGRCRVASFEKFCSICVSPATGINSNLRFCRLLEHQKMTLQRNHCRVKSRLLPRYHSVITSTLKARKLAGRKCSPWQCANQSLRHAASRKFCHDAWNAGKSWQGFG